MFHVKHGNPLGTLECESQSRALAASSAIEPPFMPRRDTPKEPTTLWNHEEGVCFRNRIVRARGVDNAPRPPQPTRQLPGKLGSPRELTLPPRRFRPRPLVSWRRRRFPNPCRHPSPRALDRRRYCRR